LVDNQDPDSNQKILQRKGKAYFVPEIAVRRNTENIPSSILYEWIHPHIYGEVKVEDEEEVKRNWEKIKLEEKGNRSVLSGVPQSLPALVKAMRMQEKVRAVGFDWEKKEQVWEKVEEEMNEFYQEFNLQNDKVDKQKATAEFGDLLFSLVNYARFVGIEPEEALERTNKKFIKRFQYLESQTAKEGKKLSEMSLEEMDKYWEEAKSI